MSYRVTTAGLWSNYPRDVREWFGRHDGWVHLSARSEIISDVSGLSLMANMRSARVEVARRYSSGDGGIWFHELDKPLTSRMPSLR
jgi:cell wall assembly regulator SMI1